MKVYARHGKLTVAGISVLVFMATILFGSVIARAQAADSAGQNIIEIRERYIEEPGSGLYPPGKFNGSLFLQTRSPLVYPLFFRNAEVSEGALSVWFKPMRKLQGEYDSQAPVDIPGIARLHFHAPGRRGSDDAWRFSFPNGQMDIDNAFCDEFHHLVYTWNDKVEETWLDGKLVAQKQRPQDFPRNRPGSNATLNMFSGNGQLIDELIILDRYLPASESQALYKADKPWEIDTHTIFYAPFDDTLQARGVIGAGDVVRMHVHIGRIHATFVEGEPAEFTARIFNATPEDKSLSVGYTVHDINRDVVARGSLPVTAPAGSMTDLPLPLDEIEDMGLFWAKLELGDGDTIISEETIPLGRSLAVRGRDLDPLEMTTGFDIGYGVNAPPYQKWVRVDLRGVHTGPHDFYFEKLDYSVDSLLAAGCVPVAHIHNPPRWFQEKHVNRHGLHGYYFPDAENEEAMEHWSAFIKAVAERYNGRIHHYNFFAEYYGRTSAEPYARLFNLTADIMKQADTDIQIASTIGGYYSWYNSVVPLIADRADYWTFHPYQFVSGADPRRLRDEQWIAEVYLKSLQQYGACTRFANTEFGCWHALTHAVDADGYPLNREEFNRKMQGEMPGFVAQRGLAAFVDLYTAAFRAVRGHVISLAAGCEYALWWSSVGGNMIADLHFARHTPTTASLAYANVSGLLTGHRYIKRIDLGADTLHGYLFEKDGVHALVAFTDLGDMTAFPEVGGENLSALDLYGNPVSFELVGSAIKLNLKEIIPVYVLGITSLPEHPAPVLRAESVDEYLYPGTPAQIRVDVYNPLDQKLNAAIRLDMPEVFGEQQPGANVTLAAKEQKSLVFQIDTPLNVHANLEAAITMATDTAELGEFSNPVYLSVRTSAVARRLDKPMPLDGDLTKWGDSNEFPIRIDDPEQVIVGVPHTKMYMRDQQVDWHGVNDLSARAAAAYDEENLYIAFRVWDDKVMNFAQTVPIHIYNGDSIEIFIDGRGEDTMGANTYFGDAYHIKLAPRTGPCYRSKNEKPPFHHISKPKIDMEIEGFSYASQLLDDGYTLEVKIPFATAFPAFKPEPGMRMGLAFHLNDQDERRFPSEVVDEDGNDAGAKNKVVMLWGGEPGVSSDPSKLGILILGENK